jgi:3-hydroxyisobutyrate dehydrogenase-like beta-hydroxyacid dehydrogenase
MDGSVTASKAGRRPTIGFIGLGQQGAPMARAIAAAGFDLHVWARRKASLAGLASVPHIAHETLADLARQCDIVELCVLTDDDVHELLHDRGLLRTMRRESIVVNHGTGDPRRSIVFAGAAAIHGVYFIDAPVTSADAASWDPPRLNTIVGGDAAVVERCRPAFEAFSTAVWHVGPVGTGQMAKLLNNALAITNLKNAEDVLHLAADLGMDLEVLIRLANCGSGASAVLASLLRPVTANDVEHLNGTMTKDIREFAVALRDRQLDPTEVEERGLAGVRGYADVIALVSGSRAASSGRR